jgi:hypothetical protein
MITKKLTYISVERHKKTGQFVPLKNPKLVIMKNLKQTYNTIVFDAGKRTTQMLGRLNMRGDVGKVRRIVKIARDKKTGRFYNISHAQSGA